LAGGQGFAGFRRGQLVGASLRKRRASWAQWALPACRRIAGAEGGAEIHLRLRVIGKAGVGQVPLRKLPQPLLDHRLARPPFDTVIAGEYALDVAVEDGETVAPGLGEDGAGGAAADAGQGDECVEAARELAAVVFGTAAGGLMQVAGACVVAEAGPESEDVVARRGGECRHRRQCGDE